MENEVEPPTERQASPAMRYYATSAHASAVDSDDVFLRRTRALNESRGNSRYESASDLYELMIREEQARDEELERMKERVRTWENEVKHRNRELQQQNSATVNRRYKQSWPLWSIIISIMRLYSPFFAIFFASLYVYCQYPGIFWTIAVALPVLGILVSSE